MEQQIDVSLPPFLQNQFKKSDQLLNKNVCSSSVKLLYIEAINLQKYHPIQ